MLSMQAISLTVENAHMYRILAGLLTFLPLVAFAGQPADTKDADKKAGLRVGANLPGPFQPYNVTGKFAGRYRCPITEHDGDPMVLIFTRETEPSELLTSLLVKLENVADKNRNVRLGVTAVFLDKDLTEVLGQDNSKEDLRLEFADKLSSKLSGMLKKTNDTTMQNLVVVTISCANDLAKYGLDTQHKATVVLYNKFEVVGIHDVEDLDEKTVDAILKDVADKFGATRK